MNAGGVGGKMSKLDKQAWLVAGVLILALAAWTVSGIPARPATAFSGAELNFDGELYPRWLSCERLPSGDVRQLSMKYGLTSYIAVPGGTCSKILTILETAPYAFTWNTKDGSLNAWGILVRSTKCTPMPGPGAVQTRSCKYKCPAAVTLADVQSALNVIDELIVAPGTARDAVVIAISAKSQFQKLPSQQIDTLAYPWIDLKARWFERASQQDAELVCGPNAAVVKTI